MNGSSWSNAPATTEANRRRSELLLASALETLQSTPPETIDAVTLSVPVEGSDEAAALEELALELAQEYEALAEIAVNHNHLVVRLTRQDYEEI